jgi:7,8-dihydropterin-6-yl-methyl-4-(beta-D-ribofuranosyl)aminobenzene 5'-phosphate synthase
LSITLKVVFDNRTARPGLQTGGGFACAVEGGRKLLLFDTGADAIVLFSNMRRMGLEPADVGTVVISHSHYDHAGGLLSLPMEAPDVEVYLPPDDYPAGSRRHLESCGARPADGSNGQEIAPGAFLIHTTANGMKEQSLVLKTQQNTVLLTGCAHPGIVEVAENTLKTLGVSSLVAVGGFHLRGDDALRFAEIGAKLKEMGVEGVAPAHCTEDTARDTLRSIFGQKYLDIGLGSEIDLD